MHIQNKAAITFNQKREKKSDTVLWESPDREHLNVQLVSLHIT